MKAQGRIIRLKICQEEYHLDFISSQFLVVYNFKSILLRDALPCHILLCLRYRPSQNNIKRARVFVNPRAIFVFKNEFFMSLKGTAVYISLWLK